MSRLPSPGQDNGTWGTILNDFLSVEHNADGTLKQANAIASAGSTASTALTKANAAAVDTTVIHNTGDETIAGTKTFTSAPVVPTSSFPESAITNLTADLSAKIDKSTATAKGDILAATSASTLSRVAAGADGQVLTADTTSATGIKWATPAPAPVASVVGQTGAITGTMIAEDTAIASMYARIDQVGASPQIVANDVSDDTAAIQASLDSPAVVTRLKPGATSRVTGRLFVPQGKILDLNGGTLRVAQGIINEGVVRNGTIATVQPAAPTNLIFDPNFAIINGTGGNINPSAPPQSPSTGWMKGDTPPTSMTVTVDTSGRGHGGKNALQLVNTEANAADYYTIILAGLTPGQQYTAVVWVETPVFTAPALHGGENRGIWFQTQSVAGTPASGQDKRLLTAVSGLALRTASLVPAAGETSARINMYAPQGTTLWSDPMIFQGSFTDYQSFYQPVQLDGVVGGRIENVVWDERSVAMRTELAGNALPNTISKLQNDRTSSALSVLLVGNSLTEGAGGSPRWTDYLFSSGNVGSGYYIGDYFTYQPASSDVTNISVGGMGIHQSVACFAAERGTFDAGDGFGYRRLDTAGITQLPPLLAKQYDLAIISNWQNGGTDLNNWVEMVVKMLREVGTEVIIMTDNITSTDLNRGQPYERVARRIARTYGCALADTANANRTVVLKNQAGRGGQPMADDGSNTVGVLADSVHNAKFGQQNWAATVIDTLRRAAAAVAITPQTPHLPKVPASRRANFPTNMRSFPSLPIVKFVPRTIPAGVTRAVPSMTNARNPKYGRGYDLTQASNGLYVQPVDASNTGAYDLIFGCDQYVTADLIVEGTVNATTIALYSNSPVPSLVKTITYNFQTNGRMGTVELLTLDDSAVTAPSFDQALGAELLIRTTSGDPARILGVVFHSFGRTQFARDAAGTGWAGLTLGGTWATGAGFRSVAGAFPYSDTDGATVDFDFTGTGCYVVTGRHRTGGNIDLYVDGTKVKTVDTYWGQAVGNPAYAMVYASGYARGKHHARLVLNGANASAGAAGSDAAASPPQHRIAIYQVGTTEFEHDLRLASL